MTESEERRAGRRFAAGWAFHPVVLAGAFVLQAALANGLGPSSFVRPLLVAVTASAVTAGILWVAFRNQRVAGLFTTALLLLAVSHDPIIGLLTAARDAWGGVAAFIAIGLAIFVPLVVTAVGVDQLRRAHLGDRVMRPLPSGLNVFSVALVVVVAAPALPSSATWFAAPAGVARASQAEGTRGAPDMYLFLLDGYARADELSRQFGIDNSWFVSELETRGFKVDDASRTNYTYTALTVTSLLSMEYVALPPSGVLPELELREQHREAVTGGTTFTTLRRSGYELVATAPGWEHASLRAGVDRYIDRSELTDFEMALLRRTWLPDVPIIPRDLFFDNLRDRINGVLDDAVSVAGEDRQGPAFTFVHVPSPHLPLAFEEDGTPTPYGSRQYLAGQPGEFGLTEDQYDEAYAGNLAYLNTRMLATIDAVQAAGDLPPVIVIMSDHGYKGDSPVHDEAMLHSFFAASTPGRPGLLERSPTPVNLMRELLTAYLGANLGPLLPERHFTTVISGPVQAYDLALTEVRDP